MQPERISKNKKDNDGEDSLILELPTMAQPYSPPTRFSLDQAYQFCEDYWRWFGIHQLPRQGHANERCTIEFQL
jgi:hypothetical protein